MKRSTRTVDDHILNGDRHIPVRSKNHSPVDINQFNKSQRQAMSRIQQNPTFHSIKIDNDPIGFHQRWITPRDVVAALNWSNIYPDTPGFYNMGNTCFLNAALQCLLYCPPFTQSLLQHNHTWASKRRRILAINGRKRSKSNKKTSHTVNDPSVLQNNTENSFCPFCSIENLASTLFRDAKPIPQIPHTSSSSLRYLRSHTKQMQNVRRTMAAATTPSPNATPIYLTDFVNHITDISNSFSPGRQEDAHELIIHLLDSIIRAQILGCNKWNGLKSPVLNSQNKKLLSTKNEYNTLVHACFGGCLQSSIQCDSCGYQSVSYDPFLDISLEINHADSVETALHHFTSTEQLDGSNRYRCENCKNLVEARKWFSIRRAPNTLAIHLKRFDHLRKNTNHIAFDNFLDLTPYMTDHPSNIRAQYSLCAVLVHYGSTSSSGHYYSYVKNTDGCSWSLKDDTKSQSTSFANVQKQNAYILFYQRQHVEGEDDLEYSSRDPHPDLPSDPPPAQIIHTFDPSSDPNNNDNSLDSSDKVADQSGITELCTLQNQDPHIHHLHNFPRSHCSSVANIKSYPNKESNNSLIGHLHPSKVTHTASNDFKAHVSSNTDVASGSTDVLSASSRNSVDNHAPQSHSSCDALQSSIRSSQSGLSLIGLGDSPKSSPSNDQLGSEQSYPNEMSHSEGESEKQQGQQYLSRSEKKSRTEKISSWWSSLVHLSSGETTKVFEGVLNSIQSYRQGAARDNDHLTQQIPNTMDMVATRSDITCGRNKTFNSNTNSTTPVVHLENATHIYDQLETNNPKATMLGKIYLTEKDGSSRKRILKRHRKEDECTKEKVGNEPKKRG